MMITATIPPTTPAIGEEGLVADIGGVPDVDPDGVPDVVLGMVLDVV